MELGTDDYIDALADAAGAGLMGGGIYDVLLADVLLAHAAKLAKSATIYTWNVKHFTRISGKVAARVKTPDST